MQGALLVCYLCPNIRDLLCSPCREICSSSVLVFIEVIGQRGNNEDACGIFSYAHCGVVAWHAGRHWTVIHHQLCDSTITLLEGSTTFSPSQPCRIMCCNVHEMKGRAVPRSEVLARTTDATEHFLFTSPSDLCSLTHTHVYPASSLH